MELSIIVPAYNEEKRILPFLKRLEAFSKKLRDYELIFVDDGSRDGTLKILREFSRKNNHARIISYEKNQGKGYAVRKGVLKAAGRKILFIDADGSIDPSEISKLAKSLDKYEVVVGTRTHPESRVHQSSIRKITSFGFNTLTGLLFGIGGGDKLCGFKGFRRAVAKTLFKNLRTNRWAFDIELLYQIKKKGYSLYHLPISWIYKKDSKMGVFEPLKISLELISLKARLSTKN